MNKQKGHEGDVERLIEEHQPQLKAFIHRRVSSKEDAEDILQDVFYQLVKAVSNTLNPIEQVTSWLYRVTRNTIINKGKKKSEEEWPVSAYAEEESVLSEFSEVLFANDDLAPSPETEYMRSLVWQELEAALGELPAEQRTVFELMELEGLSVKEVAEATGASANTVLSRKHYAVKHLRKRLEGLLAIAVFYSAFSVGFFVRERMAALTGTSCGHGMEKTCAGLLMASTQWPSASRKPPAGTV